MTLGSDLLRFATAGSVDDGKSTLIGRLLYDSKSVFQDQLESVERTSADRGDDYTNLALLTDGLRAEREQGITIDVAYRYFSTPVRSFIVADTPGHVQYTRNMVTGASTADLALVLVDARKGVIEQTRRHAALSALLRVPHLVLAVNKMDLVGFDQGVYDRHRPRLHGAHRRPAHALRRAARRHRDPAGGAAGRQRRAPQRGDALVRRARRCSSTSRASTSSATTARPRPGAVPGAVRHPADVDRAARLPRLRRHARQRHAARRRRGRRRCRPGGRRRSPASTPSTARSTRPSPARPSPCAWPRSSTSAAAT